MKPSAGLLNKAVNHLCWAKAHEMGECCGIFLVCAVNYRVENGAGGSYQAHAAGVFLWRVCGPSGGQLGPEVSDGVFTFITTTRPRHVRHVSQGRLRGRVQALK